MFKNVIEDMIINLIGGFIFIIITLGLTFGFFYLLPRIIYQLII